MDKAQYIESNENKSQSYKSHLTVYIHLISMIQRQLNLSSGTLSFSRIKGETSLCRPECAGDVTAPHVGRWRSALNVGSVYPVLLEHLRLDLVR